MLTRLPLLGLGSVALESRRRLNQPPPLSPSTTRFTGRMGVAGHPAVVQLVFPLSLSLRRTQQARRGFGPYYLAAGRGRPSLPLPSPSTSAPHSLSREVAEARV